MEENITQQLIKSVKSIQAKVKQMKNEEDQTGLTMKKLLNPITVPIKTLVENTCNKSTLFQRKNLDKSNSLHSFRTSSEDFRDLNSSNTVSNEDQDDDDDDKSEKTIISYKSSDLYDDVDDDQSILVKSLVKDDLFNIYENINIPYGIRSLHRNLFMGNSKAFISKIDNVPGCGTKYFITIDTDKYELTPGLKELILTKKPDLSLVSESDKVKYKNMLSITNAHRRDYHPNGQIKGDKSVKYRYIIKPLFNNSNSEKHGGNLPKFKTYRSNTDLVYWDDPNELVERLKLLIASKEAGNTNHDNEILSIVEELKECGIIKE